MPADRLSVLVRADLSAGAPTARATRTPYAPGRLARLGDRVLLGALAAAGIVADRCTAR